MRRSIRPAAAIRGGFTLVELLVATALCLVVMTVLSLTFQVGMDTLSTLKSVTSMADQLRTAGTIIERDLRAPHLETALGDPLRVSDPRLAGFSPLPAGQMRGFLRFHQEVLLPGFPPVAPPLNTVDETAGLPPENGVPSLRATADFLHFTVRLSGTDAQEAFGGRIFPGGSMQPLLAESRLDLTDAATSNSLFMSPWAEVIYFLRPQPGVSTSDEGGPSAPPIPVFTLHRRVRVLAPNNAVSLDPNLTGPTADPPTNYPEISSAITNAGPPIQFQVNSPATITNPQNRLGGQQSSEPGLPNQPFSPIQQGNQLFGADVLLNNVISFHVQPIYDLEIPQALFNNLSSQAAAAMPPRVSFQARDLPERWDRTAFPNSPPGPTSSPTFEVRTREYDTALPVQPLTFRNGNGQVIATLPFPPGNNPQITAIPKPRIKALVIKLRVYDSKNKGARQITIVQDL